MLTIALAIYAAAMTAANLSIAALGPRLEVVAANAFFLIGLDLMLRDWLHVRLTRWQMLALIAGAGAITWAANPAAQFIALASAASFVLAAVADWLAFTAARGTWLSRSLRSNVAGAAVDSVAFPLLAFGGLDPVIVVGMFAAKVAGGAAWALLLARVGARRAA